MLYNFHIFGRKFFLGYGGPSPTKKSNLNYFNKSGKFSQGAFLVFSYCTGPILLEIIESPGFEVLVSMVDGSKHGVP